MDLLSNTFWSTPILVSIRLEIVDYAWEGSSDNDSLFYGEEGGSSVIIAY